MTLKCTQGLFQFILHVVLQQKNKTKKKRKPLNVLFAHLILFAFLKHKNALKVYYFRTLTTKEHISKHNLKMHFLLISFFFRRLKNHVKCIYMNL